MFKSGHVGHQIYNVESVLNTGEAQLGDLCLVPIEMFLAASHSSHIQPIPSSLAVKFVHVDLAGNTKKGSGIHPILTLFCIQDIDTYLTLTGEDYEESLNQTKIFGRTTKANATGLWNYDYIVKYDDFSIRPKTVDLFLVKWAPTDLLSVIPGVVEVRARKNWFYGDTTSQNMYKALTGNTGIKNEIELPVVGLVGTVLQTRNVIHDYDERGNIIVGDKCQSTFYQILLKDRVPVWVQGPVWKCPDELILPVYLPVP